MSTLMVICGWKAIDLWHRRLRTLIPSSSTAEKYVFGNRVNVPKHDFEKDMANHSALTERL